MRPVLRKKIGEEGPLTDEILGKFFTIGSKYGLKAFPVTGTFRGGSLLFPGPEKGLPRVHLREEGSKIIIYAEAGAASFLGIRAADEWTKAMVNVQKCLNDLGRAFPDYVMK